MIQSYLVTVLAVDCEVGIESVEEWVKFLIVNIDIEEHSVKFLAVLAAEQVLGVATIDDSPDIVAETFPANDVNEIESPLFHGSMGLQVIEISIHHVGGLAELGAGREIGLVDFAPVRHISLGEIGADEVLDQFDVVVIKTFCVAHLDVADGIGRYFEGGSKCHGSVILVVIGVDDMDCCFERRRERMATPSFASLNH